MTTKPKPALHIFMEAEGDPPRWAERLRSRFDVVANRLDRASPSPGSLVVIDLGEGDAESEERLVEWRRANDAMVGLYVIAGPPERRRAIAVAGLLRDANFVSKPVDPAAVQTLIEGLFELRFGAADRPEVRRALYDAYPAQAAALRMCDDVLNDLFGMFSAREPINIGTIGERSAVVVDTLQDTGLQEWGDAVRQHHNSTYQHCQLVTGLIVRVGMALGMRAADLRRLAVGGLLHDLGKAAVPVEILDKPAALTPEETRIVQRHPSIGAARLANARGVTEQMIQMVRDHHEYLDGSGYPAGLTAEQLPDPVRLLTIVDIFAALVERRPYRSIVSAQEAVASIAGMGEKIDGAILRAVRPTLELLR